MLTKRIQTPEKPSPATVIVKYLVYLFTALFLGKKLIAMYQFVDVGYISLI